MITANKVTLSEILTDKDELVKQALIEGYNNNGLYKTLSVLVTVNGDVCYVVYSLDKPKLSKYFLHIADAITKYNEL